MWLVHTAYLWSGAFPLQAAEDLGSLGSKFGDWDIIEADHCILLHMSIGSLIPTISTYSKDLSPDKDNQACINLSASLAPHT